jgi:chromosome segregation ATPase
MSVATIDAPVEEPLRELVDNWTRNEAGRAEDLQRLLEPLEQAVGQLSDWANRIAAAEASEAEARRDAVSKEQAADTRRRRLEHDLKLARDRVTELEQLLLDRTEELLRMQAANNRLAAELREIGDDEPLLDGPLLDGPLLEESPPNASQLHDPQHYDEALTSDDGDLMAAAVEAVEAQPLADFGAVEHVAERFARLRHN